MKSVVASILLLAVSSYGADLRHIKAANYICKAEEKSKHFSVKDIFTVAFKNSAKSEEVLITNQSGKTLRAVQTLNDSVFLIKDGDLQADKSQGYLMFDGEKLVIATKISRGSYENDGFTCEQIGQADVEKVPAEKKALEEIADNAELGNGSAGIKTYNMKTFDADKALAKDLAKVKARFSNEEDGISCGPYKTTKDRRGTIAVIKDLSIDQNTVEALTKMYNEKKILKMYSIQTNNEIECSRTWVQVYTTEGYVLELYYGLND